MKTPNLDKIIRELEKEKKLGGIGVIIKEAIKDLKNN